jgi:tetratricopeptide (TPR) repeat protein
LQPFSLFSAGPIAYDPNMMVRLTIFGALLVGVAIAADPPTPAELQQAVRDLGADEFTVREKATSLLWSAGRAAEPLLREALRSTDAEVVARARDLLDKIPYGVTPESPRQFMALVARARAASPSAWPEIVREMIEDGPGGLELARSLAEKQDGARRVIFLRGIDKEGWRAAPRMIRAGDFAGAGRVLERAAAWHAAAEGGDVSVIRHYAVFARLRGELDKAIAAWQRRAVGPGGTDGFLDDGEPGGAGAAPVLFFLAKAKGDTAAAVKHAEASKRGVLIESARFDAGEWAKLVNTPAPDRMGQTILEAGLKMMYARMAGPVEAAAAARAEFAKAADDNKDNSYDAWLAVRAVMFDGRPADALAMIETVPSPQGLIARGEITAQIGKPAEALKLLADPKIQPGFRLFQTAAQARVLALTGQREKLVERLAEMKRDRYTNSLDRIPAGELVEWLVAVGRDSDAADHAAALLAGNAPDVFPKMFPRTPLAGEAWHSYYRSTAPTEAVRDVLFKSVALCDGRLNEPGRRATFDAAVGWARSRPTGERAKLLRGFAEAAFHAGWDDVAQGLLADAAAHDAPAAHLQLGDLHAANGRWAEAAAAYAKAADSDAYAALANALAGAARVRAGDAAAGTRLLQISRMITLGDEAARAKLYEELAKRASTLDGLTDEVRLHRTLIVDLSFPGSNDARNALSRNCQDSAMFANHAAARKANEQFLVRMLRTNAYFKENSGYLNVLHRIKMIEAQEALAAGDVPGVLRRAAEAHDTLPTTPTLAIELVPALDKLGKKAEADECYARVAKRLDALIGEFPASDYYLGQRALLAVRCRRDLPAARDWAKKSVTLAPEILAHREVLAEANLQNGDGPAAAAALRAALARQPRNAYLKKLLARAEAGDPKAPLPER